MIAKRIFDMLVSFVGLLLAGPVLAGVAGAILVTSGRPVIFRQDRVGLNGSSFQIYKFRTMAVGHGGPNVSAVGDTRVTAVGRVLRKWKLDEAPQLINVLMGTMSLVGPRPEVPEYVAKWPNESRETILSVRPGVTDRASIEFRNEAEMLAGTEDPAEYYERVILPRKAAIYVDYVNSRSFLEDLKILCSTIGAVLRR